MTEARQQIIIQIDEQKLRQLFKNRSNCYADSEDVVQAMDEDCFIKTVNEALRLLLSVRSEQLVCDCGKQYHERDLEHGMCHKCWQPTKKANQLPTTFLGYTQLRT